MLIFLKRVFFYSFIIICLCSLALNGVLFYAAHKFYTQFKIAQVFPTHENFYRAKNAQLSEKTQKRVVLFGDSRIHQWKKLPQIDEVEFINRGIGGETTAQLRARFEPDVLALDPDVVILQLGINDLVAIGLQPKREKAIVQQCRENLSFLVETLQAKSIEVILLTIIPPAQPSLARLLVWSEHIPQQVAQINRYWLELPATAKLHVVDTAKILTNEAGNWHENINKDTLHLTPIGYEYLNQAIVAILKNL
jgi:lysophospholipase L1-like esterase